MDGLIDPRFRLFRRYYKLIIPVIMTNIDILWAPWRMAYITENKDSAAEKTAVAVGPHADPKCFLCQAVFDDANDRTRFVIRRTEWTLSVLNRFPYNNGHILVAPRNHCGNLSGLTETEKIELIREIDRWTEILTQHMSPDGFNIGLNLGHAAGAGLPGHLHWHIVPRWNGDTNYMATIGSTHVIPQSLEALWTILTGK
ncbi:MAG: HIT domain-containing protein [Planctomycetaceae bacterium]|jgi:ATP adenylyltransferase|nr:HIT domain-containing protein [Planctomycetaceae bacterium]